LSVVEEVAVLLIQVLVTAAAVVVLVDLEPLQELLVLEVFPLPLVQVVLELLMEELQDLQLMVLHLSSTTHHHQ
jgi:hypothetical protein